ncbi:MAG: hypothetical protein H6684_16515 [Deltaproteobacteria bacterium]|nr:hypothetical protein [Deltaproteobacteria bacterium]MCB9490337.1 hypothetical protein [Deltaproteobacteria bacterium]
MDAVYLVPMLAALTVFPAVLLLMWGLRQTNFRPRTRNVFLVIGGGLVGFVIPLFLLETYHEGLGLPPYQIAVGFMIVGLLAGFTVAYLDFFPKVDEDDEDGDGEERD